MAKNISILEGRKARNFSSVKKLRTTLGSGTQDWIPEDEAGKYCNFDTIEITENGTYYADGVDGYDVVIVDVHDGEGDLGSKAIFRNGEYKPVDDNLDGYSVVSVNVGGGGGDYTIEWEKITSEAHGEQVVEFNGLIYARDYNGGMHTFNGSSWTEIAAIPNGLSGRGTIAVYNNQLISVGFNNIYYYNGSTWEVLMPAPQGIYYAGVCECNGRLHICGGDGFQSGSYNYHFIYDGAQWTNGAATPVSGNNHPFSFNNELYIMPHYDTHKIFKYTGNDWQEFQYIPAMYMCDGNILINGEEHKFLGQYNSYPYSFNGQFARPESKPTDLTGYPLACSLNGVPYLIGGGGVFRGTIVTAAEVNNG